VTGHSGHDPKSVTFKPEIAVTFPRNDRSRSSGTAGHVRPESAVSILRNTHKAWLHEQVFGVAVIPEQDVEFYSAAFRDLAPAPAKLIVAHELLERFPDIPQQIAQELDTKRAALLRRASRAKHQLLPVEQGYLVAIECSAEILLTQHSLLSIPASAFGSRRSDWSVASALPVAGASS
jgi:hypothetical protein